MNLIKRFEDCKNKKQPAKNGQKSRSGQGLVEYGLILLVVSVVSILLIGALSDGVRDTFRSFIDNNPAPPPGVAPIGGEYAPKIPTPTPIVPPPNPVMILNPDPPIIQSGGTVNFQSQSTAAPGNTIVSTTWDFGDGTTGAGTNVSHVFTTDLPEESFTVVMTVRDNNGSVSTLSREVGVQTTGSANLEPISRFFISTDVVGDAPLSITFQSQAFDPDGDALTYTWRTNDPRRGDVAGGTSFSHVYEEPGIYYPTLLVEDSAGNISESTSIAITVNGPPRVNEPPTVNAGVSGENGFAPFNVDFSILSFDDDIEVKSFAWDFGDGSSYQRSSVAGGVPIISHIYDQVGTYEATVTIWDDEEATATQTFEIVVEAIACGNKRIKAEYYMGINGGQVRNLTDSSKYPNSPDDTFYFGQFEGPRNYTNNYGARFSGFIVPPETGTYTFFIAGDDRAELWLSTDDTAGNKRLIATVPRWTGYQQWDRRSGQNSAPITLNAGQFYYVEALMKERGGGDHLSVGWRTPSNNEITVISGNYLCAD